MENCREDTDKPPLKGETKQVTDRVLIGESDVVLSLEGIRLPVYPFGFGYCMPHKPGRG
jgi:hypothetical protein